MFKTISILFTLLNNWRNNLLSQLFISKSTMNELYLFKANLTCFYKDDNDLDYTYGVCHLQWNICQEDKRCKKCCFSLNIWDSALTLQWNFILSLTNSHPDKILQSRCDKELKMLNSLWYCDIFKYIFFQISKKKISKLKHAMPYNNVCEMWIVWNIMPWRKDKNKFLG